MSGATKFSTLDASQAFWQVRLSETSAKYTTFDTPFGRYCYKRLPYGVCTAPEVFHRCFKEMFGDIPGVEVYIDDILIYSRDEKEHADTLRKVLQRAKERNVRFNKDKCKFSVEEVKYLGHVFSKVGIKLDDDKVKAISDMKTPKTVSELETFLGMITYVSKFIPNVSQITNPLRELIKGKNLWRWEKEQNDAFEKLKSILISKPVLQYFDANTPVVLSVDASKDGVGAVLLQNNLPVIYASKALTETQKGYAQIEKEALAILYGCERFYQYLYGRFFVVENDHKPLEIIFKKPLSQCPARLQRIRIRLQIYDLEVNYKPGKELYLADALSRSKVDDKSHKLDQELDLQVYTVISNIPMSDEKKVLFEQETAKDETLQIVKQLILKGWPVQKEQVPDSAKPYFTYREVLSVIDNVIFKGKNVVVPKSLRKDMLDRIHVNHLGMEKSKNRARDILFWPNMSKDIENLVSSCETCLKYQRANTKEPMWSREIPFRPWEVLATDLFEFKGNIYLLVVDVFSKYIEVVLLRETTAEAMIKNLKTIFARMGIPKIVYSDNGPQYDSWKYKRFAKEWNFKFQTSSPKYPQSNGLVERHIQTVKNIMKKVEDSGGDPYIALLELRNTPVAGDIQSPSEIIFGRKVNGVMPIKENFFPQHHSTVRDKLIQRQKIQKYYYDRGSKPLKTPEIGQTVYVKNPSGAKGPLVKAKVVARCERPRSFRLQTLSDRTIERNQRYILKGSCDSQFELVKPPEYEFNNKEVQQPEVEVDQKVEESSQEVAQSLLSDKVKEKSVEVEQEPRTRSGRVVRKPKYMSEYVT